MQPAKTFYDLIVWQKAHEYVLQVYQYTSNFPKTEIFGITSQYRRAAISIASNIAEGFKKRGIKDKARFMNIAQGSIEECRYYQILSMDLNYGSSSDLNEQLEQVSRLLTAYHSAIIKSSHKGFLFSISFSFF
jgi:four helix bundle protein